MNFNQVHPFLDGVSRPSVEETSIRVINPSNGLDLLTIPKGCSTDVDQAVASARRTERSGVWSRSPPSLRRSVLTRFAELIAERAAELDFQDAEEMGKPISEQAFNAVAASHLMRFYAECLDKLTGDVFSSDVRTFAAQRAVPRGVVAAIVPWNFPTYNAVLKIAPALAAGNSVVLKPSELASRSSILLAQLAIDAGLPPGVLNVTPGLGDTVGKALGLHRDVDMVAFTGSTDVGKLMLEYSGRSNMKAVQAECGGKSPHILFDDGIDVEGACLAIARQLTTNQGQICSVGSRLLVPRELERSVLDCIAAAFAAVRHGSATEADTTFGPLSSLRQCERVLHYVSAGLSEGANLVCGGRQVDLESGGFFVEPTLFSNVRPDARIAQEEIFGPVLSVTVFDTEEQAIHFANATPYGLIAYAWTTDLGRAMRLSHGIASSVVVNAGLPAGEGSGHAASIEPWGLSGIGVEGGLAGIANYQRRQSLWLNYG